MGLFSKGKSDRREAAAAAAARSSQPTVHIDTSKLALQTKLAKNRIQLHRNKVQNNVDRNEYEVSRMLLEKREDLARTKTEQILRDMAMKDGLSIVENYCDQLMGRTYLVQGPPEPLDSMPIELRQCVFSIVYASARFQVEELRNIRDMLKSKYGADAINQLAQGEGPFANSIDQELVRRLGLTIPEEMMVLTHMENIAKKFEVPWSVPPDIGQRKSVLDMQRRPANQMQFSADAIPGGGGYSAPQMGEPSGGGYPGGNNYGSRGGYPDGGYPGGGGAGGGGYPSGGGYPGQGGYTGGSGGSGGGGGGGYPTGGYPDSNMTGGSAPPSYDAYSQFPSVPGSSAGSAPQYPPGGGTNYDAFYQSSGQNPYSNPYDRQNK